MTELTPALAAAPPVETIPAPETLGQAIAALHRTSMNMDAAARKLLELEQLRFQTPEMRTILINPGNNGRYQTLDAARWTAKSIAVLNPNSVTVYIGAAGQSATAAARVPSCPPNGLLVLPIQAADLLLGCDAAALGANTAVVQLFRFVTVQPLFLAFQDVA